MLQAPLSDKYDELVGLAYRGIEESRPWQGFVECFTEAAGLRDSSVVISSSTAPDDAIVVTSDHSPHITPDYVHRVLKTGPMRIINSIKLPEPVSVSELVTQRRWLESDLYLEYLEPFNINRMLMVDVWRDPVMLVRLSMDRTPDQSDFDANDRRLVASLAKHLANGLQLRSTFQATCISNRFYQEALDQLGISAIFINAAGQVVHTNHTAMSLLERKHGLCLRRGKLAVSEGRSGDKLRALVRSLLGPDNQGPQGMCLLDEQGNTLVQIVGRSLPGHDTPDLNRPTAVLLVTPYRNAASEPSAELIRDLFGLTEREARIAGLLTQGYDMHEAAVVLEVSVNTVKTHLRGIFVKMGYNNQAQVISALQNSAVRLL